MRVRSPRLARADPLLALAGTLQMSLAVAAPVNWTIQPPEHAAIASGEGLALGIPLDLPAAELASLAIELDHIDVTALARIANGSIVYAPPQPLGLGPHELRVVEYRSNGRLVPRGAWSFTVTADGRTAGAGHRASLRGSIGLQASERIADSNLTPPDPPRLTANGTFDLKGVATQSEWKATAIVQGLYGSDNGTSSVGGQGIQPAQMQLALEHTKDGLIVGDQTLPFDNLVISGLSRRGVSGHLAELPLGTELTAFSVRDSAIAGFYGGLGIGNSDDLVSGGIVQAHPFASAPKALTLQGAVVTGTAPAGLSVVVPYPGGNGSYPPTVPVGGVMPVQSGSGSAWVLGASSEIPHSTLHLNGQFASSSFDFPGTSMQVATHAHDDAYSVGAGFSAPLPSQWNFTLNAGYQNVGTYFVSLANPSLPPDRRTATASATVTGHGLTVSGSGGFTEDNTDDNAAVATVRSLPRSLNASYSPTLAAGVTSWLGTPSLNLAWQNASTHDVSRPAASQPTDSAVVNDSATVSFAYPHLSWQAGLTGGTFRDYTGQQDDTDTFGPTLGVNATFGSGFAAVNVQLLDAHDLKSDTHTLDRNYSLTAGDTFFASKLTGQLTLAINHNTQQIVPGTIPPQLVGNDVVLRTATAQLTWHALAATSTRGGLDCGLSSSWNESTGLNSAALTSQGFSALATRGLQVFLSVSTKWPLSFGATP